MPKLVWINLVAVCTSDFSQDAGYDVKGRGAWASATPVRASTRNILLVSCLGSDEPGN